MSRDLETIRKEWWAEHNRVKPFYEASQKATRDYLVACAIVSNRYLDMEAARREYEREKQHQDELMREFKRVKEPNPLKRWWRG